MPHPKPAWRKVMNQPGSFTLQVLKAFQKNQGLLLAGALAYYILLSVIPLFTLVLLMLSHVVDEAALMATLRRYIGLIIPGDSVLEQVRNILEHREDYQSARIKSLASSRPTKAEARGSSCETSTLWSCPFSSASLCRPNFEAVYRVERR